MTRVKKGAEGRWKAAPGRAYPNKKRTLLYLLPGEASVTVAIVLGERAYGLAMARTLSGAIKRALSEARPHAERRGIRFRVKTSRDLATIKKLVTIKRTPR